MQTTTPVTTAESPAQQTLLSKLGKKFQSVVKKVRGPVNVLQKITEGDYKKQFIDKYGVTLEMPANYIYDAFFYKPDDKYIITANCMIFPKNMTYLDFQKINTMEDPADNDFVKNEMELDNKLSFKIFELSGNKYTERRPRICDSSYEQKLCFTEDKTKVAIFRKEKSQSSAFESQNCIDIFDCSNIDFFLRDEPVSPLDPNLILTIKGPQLQGTSRLETIVFGFSVTHKCLYIIQQQKTLKLYNIGGLDQDTKVVTQPIVHETLLPQFECILDVAVNEDDIADSLFAVKKAEYKAIEFFSVSFLQELRSVMSTGQRLSLRNAEINKISEKYPISSIRLNNFNLSQTKIKFSRDMTHVLFCDNTQNIMLQLADQETPQHLKSINHVQNSKCRAIYHYGDSDFLMAAANSQDHEITIFKTGDQQNVKLDFKFTEGPVEIRDIMTGSKSLNKLLITKDDEEFLVYQWDDEKKYQKTKIQRSHKFNECSNYIFEWPFMCYVKDQRTLIIHNIHSPNTAFFIEIGDFLKEYSIIDIQFSDANLLYVLVESKNHYYIFEKNLTPAYKFILRNFVDNHDGDSDKLMALRSLVMKNKLAFQSKKDQPVATILKEKIENKPINSIFVRNSIDGETLHTNIERMVFFHCDNKLYYANQSIITLVDTCASYKMVNPSILAYNRADEQGKPSNTIRYLNIASSDYNSIHIYEEVDGILSNYLVQEGLLLIFSQTENSSNYQAKILKVSATFQPVVSQQLQLEGEEAINNLLSAKHYQNSMIPIGNEIYNLCFNDGETFLHSYKNVINLRERQGNQTTFNSPIVNPAFRRMVYFVINKKGLQPKKAIILPYLNDTYSIFNKRNNMIEYSTFFQGRNESTHKKEKFIITLIPQKKQLLQHNLKGQLIQMKDLKENFQVNGDQNIAISNNGLHFLQRSEEDPSQTSLQIMKITLEQELLVEETEQKQTLLPSKAQELKKLRTSIDFKQIESINLEQIAIEDDAFKRLNKMFLHEIINYFQSQRCDVIYKINDNHDILIGFSYFTKLPAPYKSQKILKELLLIKREPQHQRSIFKIRLTDEKLDKSDAGLTDRVTSSLLQTYVFKNKKEQEESEKQFFSAMNVLEMCTDFCLTNDKIIVWSRTQLFSADINCRNSSTRTIQIKKSKFEIDQQDDHFIDKISANGQNEDDLKRGNYYIYVKISMEKNAFFMKYNINKDKEFQSFDCSNQAMIFFDNTSKGFILDSQSIIDIDQAIPLHFFKTGMDLVQRQYLLGGQIDRGSRFSEKNEHFLVQHTFFVPINYFIYVLLDNNLGKTLSREMYDPNAFYLLEGSTVLHSFANNYKNLEFLLEEFQKTNPKLLNMLLLKNSLGLNVLQVALKHENSRCVNLILEKLTQIQMNNIHALKENFEQLLNYSGFEEYLRLCFFSNKQMKSKLTFCRKEHSDEDSSYIDTHDTSFIDKEFYHKFMDETQPSKQVIIRGLDAGWMQKHQVGIDFQTKLSESENMSLFEIETIKLIVNYQWSLVKPLMLKYLFIPFIFNMLLYNFYCVNTYENFRLYPDDLGVKVLNNIVQILILLFTCQQIYVEYKQIEFHRAEYLQSFWNLMDMVTVIMAPLTVILDLMNVEDKKVRPFMAVCNMTFYLRFFYFMRIFDSSAHLIRTIIVITIDSQNFLFVFILGIIGFGASFQILSNNNDPSIEGAQFLSSFSHSIIYSYRMSLGDFSLDAFDVSEDVILIWSLFVICSIFTTVILLNMLIAIMGESFNKVNEEAEQQRVREHLQLIVENDFLIDRKKFFGKVKFLIEIKDDIDDHDNDEISKKLNKFEEFLKDRDDQSKKEQADMRNMMKHESQQIGSLKVEINHLKDIMVKISKSLPNNNDNNGSNNQDDQDNDQDFNFGTQSTFEAGGYRSRERSNTRVALTRVTLTSPSRDGLQ